MPQTKRRPRAARYGRRPKKTMRRSTKLSVGRGLPRLPIVHMKRTSYAGTMQLGTATTFDFWRFWEPSLGSFNNFSELANVFEQVRVNAVKLTFRPRFESVNAPITGNTPMTTVMPYVTMIVDPQSGITPTGAYNSSTLNLLLEGGGKTRRANRPFSVYFKPWVSIPTNTNGGVIFKKTPWLRTTDTGVPHKGAHIMFHTNSFSTSLVDCVWDIYIGWYVSLRNLK